jgi:UDP-2,3-diacylglucosamine pyrophosphatase LpxH
MDWDHMMYQWVAAFCAEQKNVEFHIPKNFSTIFKVAGRNVLIMHGDSISGGGSSASFTRMVGQMRGLQQQNKETEDVQHFDDVMIGHFHRIDEYDIGTGSLYVCGTMKGSDEFTTNRLHVSSPPKHMVTYWHPDHGNVSKEIIRLDKFDSSDNKFASTIPEVWGGNIV